MAMFAEEENEEIIETNTQDGVVDKVTKVVSGGVALPHQVKSEIELINQEPNHDSLENESAVDQEDNSMIQQVACPHCPTKFNIAIPDADEAVVACPTCGEDFILRFA